MNHLCKEARRVCATGEAEDVDVVSLGVVAHEEPVAGENMMHEGCADGLINRKFYRIFQTGEEAAGRRRIGRLVLSVGSDAGLERQ